MNQTVWVGIAIGVFFAGLGVGYAVLQSTAPATPVMTQQQMQQMVNDPNMMNQLHQTMLQNPQAMNRWMSTMMKDQQFMQQMHNSMINDPQHMQTMSSMMGPDMMGYMMNNPQMNQQMMSTMMANQQYMHDMMMNPQFQQNWMGPWMSNRTNWNHMMDSGWMSQEMMGNHMMGSDMMMGTGMMGTPISNQSPEATIKELEKFKMAEQIAFQHLETFDQLDFDVFTNQNWTRLHESHSQNIVVHWPDGRTTQGIEPHIEDLKSMFVYAPDTRIEQHPIKIASGNWTSVVGVIEGTFTEPMPLPDGNIVPPTGKSFKLSMVTVGYWENGVMTEEYLFWDNLEFMKQIGLA